MYGLFLVAALLTYALVTERRVARDGDTLLGRPMFVAIVLIAACVGARAHVALQVWGDTRDGARALAHMLHPQGGGTAFFGAVAGLCVAIVAVRDRVPGGSIAGFLDASVPGAAAAIVVGRIGCLVVGCCAGQTTTHWWALPSPVFDGGVLRHPFPLYLALASALSAWIAHRITRAGAGGACMAVFVGLFAVGRGAAEFFRGEHAAPGFSLQQWECVGLAVGAIAWLVLHPQFAQLSRGRHRAMLHSRYGSHTGCGG